MDSLSQNSPHDNTHQKCCTKCRERFPATPQFFQRDKHTSDGLRPDCKVCRAQWNAERREEKRAYNRAYYHDHPENRDRIIAQQREYRKDPEVKAQKYAYNNQPDQREYRRLYLKEYNHRPDIKERDREAKEIAKKNRRAHQKAIAGSYTLAQIEDLLNRQKHKCYYCSRKFEKRNGKHVYHIDHTFPIDRVVGTDIPANDISYLVLACPSCNHKKSNKFPWEWPEGGRLL